MRSSTIAAAALTTLIMTSAIMALPTKLIDQRPADTIWRTDGAAAAAIALNARLAEPCRNRSDQRACAAKAHAALQAIVIPVKAAFDRCIATAWAKRRCSTAATAAIAAADTGSHIAALDAEAAKQRTVAEAQRQAAIEADRRRATEVMGADDGRSYLLAAYRRRFDAAQRECYQHAGLIRVMQWHVDADADDLRVITRVRDACHAIMRKRAFVMRPDGRNSILGYPIPPFDQLDHWLRSRCANQGRDAWRCIAQAAEALEATPAAWRELDHETAAILGSLGIVPGRARERR